MRLAADDDFFTAPAVREQRDEIAHRAAGDKHRGLFTHLRRGQFFEAIHRRIVTASTSSSTDA